MLSDDELKSAREMVEAASPGPWHAANGKGSACVRTHDCAIYINTDRNGLLAGSVERWQRDATFIAASRTLVPRLLDEINQLREWKRIYDEVVELQRQRREYNEQNPVQCAFCGKAREAVQRLIHGPGVQICNECVGLCAEICKTATFTITDHDIEAVVDASEAEQ